ncbi:hypothetical protein [Neobacillus niacini]|nr:hypothetical protein [Neobacillus niacini]
MTKTIRKNHKNGHHNIDDNQNHGNYHKIGHHNIDDDQNPWEKS